MRERLHADPSDEIIQYIYRPRLFEDIEQDFKMMMKVNQAHVVMLIRQSIIQQEAGSTILKALLSLSEAGYKALTLDPRKEDLHYNLEAYLIQQLGPEIGGQLHTGRSRNDLYATTQRMKVRDAVNHLIQMAISVRESLIETAGKHIDTIMTGYTHLQPAQPITFAHYLSGVSDAFRRDTHRLSSTYPRLNLSPLGAGALAATGFPIDRLLTADLLGFDGLMENSIDAVASRDYIPEILSALSLVAVTLSRLNQDFHTWYTNEYSYIDITDEIAGTSSIMPQKKNPSPLEHVKAKAGHIIGILISSLTCLKGTHFMHSREAGTESMALFKEAVKQAEAMMALSRAVIHGLIVNKERMRRQVSENFCTVTELADTLVREFGFSFRVAHEIVGTLVKETLDKGIRTSGAITAEMLNDVIFRLTGRSVLINEDIFSAAMDPVKNVHKKSITGGPAPEEVKRMLTRGDNELKEDRKVLESRKKSLSEADRKLEDSVQEMLAVRV